MEAACLSRACALPTNIVSMGGQHWRSPQTSVASIGKNGGIARWKHLLGADAPWLRRRVQEQAEAFQIRAPERSVRHAYEVRALCPCCGRRAALLGGAAGLLIPIQGQAAPQNLTPVSGPSGALRRWYEEFFAFSLAKGGAIYEPKVQPYKDAVFKQLQSGLAEHGSTGSTLEVVEIGVGPAPNLHYWAGWPGAVHVTGVDRNSSMEPYARENAHQPGLDGLAFDFALGTAGALPIASESVDVVVGTLILCSVDDVARSLAEVKRVLRPGGKYLFVEHVAAPDGTALRRLQDVLNPLQQALADGCHLNRETLQAVERTDFRSVDASNVYLDGLGPLSPHVVGIATA